TFDGTVVLVALLLLAACSPGRLTETPDDGGATDGSAIERDGAMPVPPDGAPPPRDAGDSAVAPMPDAGPTMACPAEPPEPTTSALSFDGVDDHVTMGAAPSLALAEVTVEAWVRRDGLGRTAGTGVGGLQLVPIAGKGRGEGDGSNIDCNYAFGFVGDVLGADFEDMATGANHPVIGTTAVPWNEWHHVAATYDGTTWRLYLDGRLDGEARAGAAFRADSIQHFGVGAAFDSMGTAAGAFHGAIDEVRVWDRARTEPEIASAMFDTIEMDEGLVGRWAFDEDDGGAPDSVDPGNDGTIVGATFVAPGAVVDRGSPPSVTARTPSDDAVIDAASTELSVTLTDDTSDAFVVRFFVREITEADDFTIAVLPDTQYYTVEGNGWERHFRAQTQWIMDNREAYDIVAVIHNGDITDHGNRFPYEWTVADSALSTLEATSDALPDGLPYGLAVGNHDQTPNGTPGATDLFNANFGVSRFTGRAYYGGHYGDRNDQSWITFSAGGLDFVVVSLEYDTAAAAAPMAWARRIFESHPDAFGILNSHFILNSAGEFGAQGRAIYDAMKDVRSLRLLTCGHVSAESRRSDTFEGHEIHSMLADYQGRAMGGSGWMRLWEISPANDEMTVRTYSPSLDAWETDANSEFTLSVDLSGAGGAFRELDVVDPAGAMAGTTWSGLEPGRIYEWYATVTDCEHTVRSSVFRFTTAP
ncbi:MAG: metallophosphoesterase, partial [Deltaproteobacteria bacterium]|nr:metallophosphoesterase [Deltaproteobacteria bacterium]